MNLKGGRWRRRKAVVARRSWSSRGWGGGVLLGGRGCGGGEGSLGPLGCSMELLLLFGSGWEFGVIGGGCWWSGYCCAARRAAPRGGAPRAGECSGGKGGSGAGEVTLGAGWDEAVVNCLCCSESRAVSSARAQLGRGRSLRRSRLLGSGKGRGGGGCWRQMRGRCTTPPRLAHFTIHGACGTGRWPGAVRLAARRGGTSRVTGRTWTCAWAAGPAVP